jgi:LPXTG-motif cell wall-anchored protein
MTTAIAPHRGVLIAFLLTVLAGLLPPLPAAAAAAQPGDSPVKVRAVTQHPAVSQGGEMLIAVEVDHGDVYHTWPAKDVKLPDDVAEFAIRTEIGPNKDDDGNRILPAWIAAYDGTQYPEAKPGKAPDPSGNSPTITVPLYAEKAIAFVRFKVRPDAPLGEQTLELLVSFQACDDHVCLMPEGRKLPVKFKIVAAGTNDLGPPNEPELFKAYDPKKLTPPEAAPPPVPPAAIPPSANTDQPKAEPAAPPSPPMAERDPTKMMDLRPVEAIVPSQPSFFGFNFGGGPIVLFLVAALGGFILNLTPCVLPVIPIKILTLTKQASTPRHALILGLWMALGVVAFWVAAGVPMAFVSRALDPSRFIFGVWWIALSIGLIIGFLGLGIMGLFMINLPQSVYALNPKVDSARGSFMFGLLTAVLGLPCFGFVAGGLLAGTATLPSSTIMIVFLGLGVGMAAPYLVLSAKPDLLKFLPKTGPASNLVKQVMGLLLMAAAAYFVAAGIGGLIDEKPYMAESMEWWAVTFFVALAGVWLTFRIFQVAKSKWPKIVMPAASFIAVLAFVVFTYGQVVTAKADYTRELAAQEEGSQADETLVSGAWVAYNEKRLDEAKATGKVVVVEFTAKWCINCKFLKRTVLDRDPVRSRITDDKHVLLLVNNTSSSAPGWEYLRSLGQTGVPTLAIYGPAIEKPIILNAYTPSTVIDALDRAAGTNASASR